MRTRSSMPDLTAEMVQQGRGPSSQEAALRRSLARQMRSARERLTSTNGLERAFDAELMRLYARQRAGARIPLGLLAVAIAGASLIWIPPTAAAFRCAVVLCVLGVVSSVSRGFPQDDSVLPSLRRWRQGFIVAEIIQSCAWVLLIPIDVESAHTFALFGLIIVTAVSTMLAATVPIVGLAGLVPLVIATLSLAAAQDTNTLLLVLMAIATQIFFVSLARRVYDSAVATMESRAEKDAIFAELEHAKANSDAARRRAEEANLAKSRFLATMSHELRTPLNAILGFSEVMKDEIFGTHVAPTYKEYSNDIHDSGKHLLNLINEILDLSRIEAGRYELNEEAVPLAYAVEEACRMMSLRARSKGQTVHTLIAPGLSRLWADERALRQIVLNALSNAVKFTPQGGEIVVKVGWTASGGQYLSVRDTGPGIPEDELGTVMSSFGRGSLAIKTAEQGSGLGLPILKGLVDLHGGGFQLISRPREGTEVIATFPASRVMDTLPAVELSEAKAEREVAVREAPRRSRVWAA